MTARPLAEVLPAIRQTPCVTSTPESSRALPMSSETLGALAKMGGALMIKAEVWGPEWLNQTPEPWRTRARELLPSLEASLTPARWEIFAVIIRQLFLFAQTLGKGPPNVTEATKIYRQALHDIPADLLETGVQKVIRSHKFNTLPAPGEIREAVSAELAVRRKWLILARMAATTPSVSPRS